MVYAFQGNAYQIGQYYQSPLYVWQANAFQIGMYRDGGTGPAAYTLNGDPGVLTLTGVAAGLNVARLLTATAGSITLTGAVASLDYVPSGPVAYDLTAAAGGITFTGAVASFDLVRAAGEAQQGGSAKPVRRRKRHYVEVDGKYYEVRDLRHAEEVLAALRERALARQRKRAKVAPRGVESEPYVAPRIAVVEPAHAEPFTQALQAKVDAVNALLARAYEDASIAARVAAEIEADEEDVAIVLGLM